MALLQWLDSNKLLVAFIVSEALVFVPSVKANSVVQLLVNLAKSVVDKVAEKLGSAA
jgi:hypothetical protein